jgi:hypothetical protein
MFRLVPFFLLAALALAIPATGDEPAKVGTGKGLFHADCDYTHRAQVDPIVNPGAASGHMHDFFGNATTNANCTNTPFSDLDRSAYWVPTLYVNDEPVTAVEPMGAYYSAGIRELSSIEPFPDDLKVIAGNARGGSQEINGQRVFYWSCPGGTVQKGDPTTAPTCATPRLDLDVRFPDCWDGVNADSPDHKSHMAYSKESAGVFSCPSSHPVQVPKLKLNFRYPTTGGPTTRLASGPINTAHADFMNGWDPDKLAGLTVRCLRADRYCGGSDGPVPGK